MIDKIEAKVGPLKAERTRFDREMDESLSILATGRMGAAKAARETREKAELDKETSAPKVMKGVAESCGPETRRGKGQEVGRRGQGRGLETEVQMKQAGRREARAPGGRLSKEERWLQQRRRSRHGSGPARTSCPWRTGFSSRSCRPGRRRPSSRRSPTRGSCRLSGLTSDNYPLFLKMLEIENHWVLDALIGDEDPFLFLSTIQPNRYVISKCFTLLTRWHPGGIYPKTLSIALGVLQNAFSSPKDGYKIYPLTIADVDNLGKHLEKEKGQNFPLNRCILDILDRIGSLQGLGWDESMEEVSRQAMRIRSFFFDSVEEARGLHSPGPHGPRRLPQGRGRRRGPSSPRTSTWPSATTSGDERERSNHGRSHSQR